jgi:hypothetical protein
MIKSVAMSLPVYTFSSSDVLVAICDKLEASVHHFWWNPNRESDRYLVWKAWDVYVSPNLWWVWGFGVLSNLMQCF